MHHYQLKCHPFFSFFKIGLQFNSFFFKIPLLHCWVKMANAMVILIPNILFNKMFYYSIWRWMYSFELLYLIFEPFQANDPFLTSPPLKWVKVSKLAPCKYNLWFSYHWKFQFRDFCFALTIDRNSPHSNESVPPRHRKQTEST